MSAIIINGGYSVFSRLTGIEQEITKLLQYEGINYTIIHVHQLNAEQLITADFKGSDIVPNIKAVQQANIVFVLTPIFKGSFSGILKTFLDLLPQGAFENKTVIPIAIGGSIAHLLALEYSLKPVLSILGGTTISNPVYVVDKQVTKTDQDQFEVVAEVTERIRKVWYELNIA